MSDKLTLLHTSSALVSTFDSLFKEKAPNIAVEHIVDEGLLSEAREKGIGSELSERIQSAMLNAAERGAKVVMCTCSSIGGPAEGAAARTDTPVFRVDRPMAEKAVATGARIIVAAALQSTIEPTCDLVRDAAQKAGKDIEIIEIICAKAWTHWEAGDKKGYAREIASALRNVADQGDVIVLAQASMAPAAELVQDLAIPVLNSPTLGVEAAIAAYRREN